MTLKEAMETLEGLANPRNIDGMKRFGIQGQSMLGISVTNLRVVAKKIKTDHSLALELWKTGYHEARILACLVADIKQVMPGLMDDWAKDFDSWDLCDQACISLFWKHPLAVEKIFEWVEREPEFERRAGFALIAGYAWHVKSAPDELLASFLPLCEKYAFDDRNFVRKAVNWAIRQVGKRNEELARLSMECCKRILAQDTKPARWIARDAIRELCQKFPQLGGEWA